MAFAEPGLIAAGSHSPREGGSDTSEGLLGLGSALPRVSHGVFPLPPAPALFPSCPRVPAPGDAGAARTVVPGFPGVTDAFGGEVLGCFWFSLAMQGPLCMQNARAAGHRAEPTLHGHHLRVQGVVGKEWAPSPSA